MMDPITPALTPPFDAHHRSVYLPRNRSLVSVKSLIALSFCTTSEISVDECARDQPGNVCSAEQHKRIRCPHCLEVISIADHTNVNLNSDSHPYQRTQVADCALEDTPVGRDSISSVPLETATASPMDSNNLSGPGGVEAVAQQLQRTIQETDQALQRLCQEIHEIHLLNPTPLSSRPVSIHSLALSEHHGHKGPNAQQNHAIDAEEKLAPEVAVSAANPEFENTAYSRRDLTLGSRPGFSTGSPLINDLGDLENFAFANARLLRTLQDRVNKVELAEKTLRLEREQVQREKAEVKQLKEQVEREKLRLMDKGLSWDDYRIDGGCDSPMIQETGRSSPSRPSMSPHGSKLAVAENEWTEEKEQKLLELEAKLDKANRAWSDEQEEIWESLERLREEKRLDEKAKKFNRQISVKVERKWSHEERIEKASKKNRKGSQGSTPRSSIRNSFTIMARKSSTGSIKRQDSDPSTPSTTREKKIFKKWVLNR